MDWSDLVYGICLALVAGLGFILEIRRQRSDERRTDPATAERLARIEAQEPVRDAMERVVKLESEVERLNDRLGDFEQAIEQAEQDLACKPAHGNRRRRSKPG